MYEYRVKVEEGMIEGNLIKDKGVVEFLRIPYALPPVGELRWKAPLPMAHWQGTRKSDRREIAGIQTKGWFGGNMDFSMLERSEDCLYLNIWKPESMKKTSPYTYGITAADSRAASTETRCSTASSWQ